MMTTLTIRNGKYIQTCNKPTKEGYTYIPGDYIHFTLPRNKIYNVNTHCICIYNKSKTEDVRFDVNLSIFTGLLWQIEIVHLRRYVFFFSNYPLNLYKYGNIIGVTQEDIIIELNAEYKYNKKLLPKLSKKKSSLNKYIHYHLLLFCVLFIILVLVVIFL